MNWNPSVRDAVQPLGPGEQKEALKFGFVAAGSWDKARGPGTNSDFNH